ncbi:RDD family protein [Rhodobacterales bacterium HKCCE2091]|nr:RDD family protein [Rhodobacterales bacterium HKCCE2091]
MTSTLPDPDTQSEFYAGVPFKRLVAWLADVVLVTLITLLLGLVTFGIGWIFFPVFYMATAFLYRWFTISQRSATLGHRLMAIEIRNAAGRRLDTGEAALHTLLYLVASAFAVPQLVSVALMALSPKGQGLHDLVLGTAAINRPAE